MKKWLFNPFEMIAGPMSFVVGIFVIFITAVVGFYSGTHLDGVIDLHKTEQITFFQSVAEGTIDWISLALFIYISGLIFSKSSIRIIDVVGTQGMARVPFLFATVFSMLFFNNKMLRYFEYKFLKTGQPVEITSADIFLFALGTLTTVLMLVWMVVLMYKSYSISCNVKGTKGVLSFIGCIIFAEVLSKFLISFVYTPAI